jgi:hypothetical protein
MMDVPDRENVIGLTRGSFGADELDVDGGVMVGLACALQYTPSLPNTVAKFDTVNTCNTQAVSITTSGWLFGWSCWLVGLVGWLVGLVGLVGGSPTLLQWLQRKHDL